MEQQAESEGGEGAGKSTCLAFIRDNFAARGLPLVVTREPGGTPLAEQVRVLESTLASDFANGRVGMRYNSYAHRSRVLRQQKAKLDLLQVSMRSQEPQS